MAAGHLLVIDDSPTVLKVIELALSAGGISGFHARPTTRPAWPWCGEARTVPDLILLDGLIPNRDAAEICRRFAGGPSPGARAGGRDGRARPGRRDRGALRQGVQRRRLHRKAVLARRLAGRRLTCRRQAHVRQPEPGARHAVGRRDARRRPAVRAAVEEALSRSADAAVAEARGLRGGGAGAGRRPGGDLDERGPRDARRAGRRAASCASSTPRPTRASRSSSATGASTSRRRSASRRSSCSGRFVVEHGDLTPEQLDAGAGGAAPVERPRCRCSAPI